MILIRHIRNNRITRTNSIYSQYLFPAACSHINQYVFNLQTVIRLLLRCQEVNGFRSSNPSVQFPLFRSHDHRVGRETGKMEAAKCYNAHKTIFHNGLDHKSAFIEMGIQHQHRTSVRWYLIIPVNPTISPAYSSQRRWRHLCVYIVHRILSHSQPAAIFFYYPDHIFFKTTGSKCIGQFFQNP